MSGQGRKYSTLEQLSTEVLNDQVHSIFLPESNFILSHYDSWLPGVKGRDRPAVKFIHKLQIPESFTAPAQSTVKSLTYRVR